MLVLLLLLLFLEVFVDQLGDLFLAVLRQELSQRDVLRQVQAEQHLHALLPDVRAHASAASAARLGVRVRVDHVLNVVLQVFVVFRVCDTGEKRFEFECALWCEPERERSNARRKDRGNKA